jgi:hypothetical protein
VALNDILGDGALNDSARQLFIWGVLYGLLSSVFEPVLTEVTQEAWEAAVEANLHRALSPDELATMVVRGWMTQAAAEAEAAKSGTAQNDFANMVNNRRNPIAPEEAAVALRRQIIPETADPGAVSFLNAIQEGNLGDQWATVIQQLAEQIPSPADVLRGVLQGQVPAGSDGRTLYKQVGGQDIDPNTNFDWYTFLFNTEGSAPTPSEAGVMARRGAIPWGDGSDGPVIEGPGAVSFHQAFLEGPWRDKWEPAFKALTVYLPPPRTVTALLKSGAITAAQASTYLTEQGLAPDLVAIYVNAATATKVAPTKLLSQANILTLLNDKLIDVPTAVADLEKLGYPADEATILATTSQAAATISSLKSNVDRVETIYLAHKIDRANALTMLANLGLDATSAAAKLDDWDILKASNIRVLTVAQIADAWEYQVYSQTQAETELQQLGYTPYDAWTILSIKAKQPLPNPPAFGPGIVP